MGAALLRAVRRLYLPVEGNPERADAGPDAAHYLLHVLRMAAGDPLEVFDGKGRRSAAKIVSLSESSALLAFGPFVPEPLPRPVVLLQGLPKGDKLELVIEKAAELHASGLTPIAAARSVVKLDEKKAEERRRRWQKIAEEASRQCGRADLLEVGALDSWSGAIGKLPAGAAVLVLDEAEKNLRLSDACAGISAETPIALCIGPEGGLAREEVDGMRAKGGMTVSLGRLILRTETAALAALSVVRHRDGLLG